MNPELPEWAIGTTDGKLVLGAQLPTKDGRFTGNAHIIGYETSIYKPIERLYVTITDAGNKIKLNADEVASQFYPPKWVSDVNEILRKFDK